MHSRTSSLEKLFRLIAEDRRELVAILFYGFLNSILFLAVPLAAQGLVNVVVSGLYLQPLAVLTVALCIGLMIGGALSLARFYLVEVMRERIFARIALRVAARLPRVCHRKLAENNGPELMNRFFDVVNIQKSWFKLAYDGPGALFEVTVGLALLAFYGVELFAMAAGLFLVGFLLIWLAGYGGLRSSLAESTQKYRVAEWLEEMVRCHDALKVNSRPEYWAQEADRRVVEFLTERRGHVRILIRQKGVYYFLSALGLSGMLGLGGYLVVGGQLTLGQLVAAELVIWSILKASQKMIGLTESLYDLLTGLEKVSVLTSMEVDAPGTTRLDESEKGLSICAEGLSFRYKSESPLVLDNLSLDISSGEMVTVLGASGSGKSSLIAVLAGFLKPTSGSVSMEHLDLQDIEPDNLARNISVLSPKAEVFSGSLYENISTGRGVGPRQIRELLEYCEGRKLLSRMPQGVQSPLASGGMTLSTSERDAILLTRCLVDRPRVLFLDDCLGGLSEAQMKRLSSNLAAQKSRCTIVSTLPTPDLVAVSDRILYLEEGRLVDLGSPKELLVCATTKIRGEHRHLFHALSALFVPRKELCS